MTPKRPYEYKIWYHDPIKFAAYLKDERRRALGAAIKAARKRAGLTQAQLAQRMHTTQSVIARLEAGRQFPSVETLDQIAQATDSHLHISFEPKSDSEPT
ncbi:helix-turn-helix domain-containing protein [Salinisphaera hydrothermalis]|uniref:helix-turn-helix domain-containing protein n=1 Tax=Salinisphaera hydrothermalis TaxID=563188 RepID=UPI00333EB140